MSFRMSMYTSSIPCSCNDVNIAWVCTESNALTHERKCCYVVFAAVLFKFVYGMYVICRSRVLAPKSCLVDFHLVSSTALLL